LKKQGLAGTARLAHASTLHGQVLESGSRRATQIEKSISSKTVVRFGPFEADLRAGELRKHGVKLKVVGQPFEVLAMLLECPGQLVTREELRARLWPTDTFVDFDHGLNAAVNKLRDALNDSAEKPNYVETLPRRGYRFISAVGLHDSQDLLVEPSSPKIQSLAVLPLENLSKDPEEEYFTDGMTDQLITNLTQIGALRVISRTSAMRYKGTKKSLPEIARELHVDAVVEGAVMWVGGRVRISAQLIEAPTDHHLWAASYERDLRDVLSMQEEVTRAIVSEIRVKLTAQEQARLVNRHPINPEAYKLYLKGRYHWNKRSLEGFQKAIEYFQLAAAKDPAYALAYVGLADTYTYFSFFDVVPPREAMPKAKAAAARALEIDNRLGEAHVSLGYVSYMYDWDWPAAGKHFEQALALNPGYSRAHTFYPFYLSSLGRSEEALAVAKHSLDLDPASPAVSHSLAVQLYLARQFDNAIAQAHKTLELDPNFAISYQVLGEVYVSRGMYREGLPELEKYSALSRGRAMSLALLGYAHARLGERSQALRMLEQLQAASKQSYTPAFSFAVVYAGLGEKDQAFTWLEKAYGERTSRLAYLKVEPLWDPLRSDPRFAELVRRIGLSP
jgi:TolB-like protein/Tfp pilus assembly protein PilF